MIQFGGTINYSNEFRDMLKYLSALTEQDQRLQALVALNSKDDPELSAMRVILETLIENACDVVRTCNTVFCITLCMLFLFSLLKFTTKGNVLTWN